VRPHRCGAVSLAARTLARLKKEQGYDVHIASMTPGDCGSAAFDSQEISRMRRGEGNNAAAVIGATYHCMEERDLLVFYNERTLEKVTRLLRWLKPGIVLTHSPADYMLDHEITRTIARAAAFAAPIRNFLADRRLGPGLPPIPHLYYCDPIEGKDSLGRDVTPGFHVDITQVIDTKADMLAAHASQRDWLLKHHGMDHYLQAMRDWSAKRGSECGVLFAEGFRQHLGHSYPQDNVLGQSLGAL